MKIGLIGYGNIGTFLLKCINKDYLIKDARITMIAGRNRESGEKIASQYRIDYVEDIDQLVESDVDLIIESATVEVVQTYASEILKKGKDFLVLSVGALADETFYGNLRLICQQSGAKLFLPSGAIGGLDILQAAKSTGQLKSVSLTTRKPPQAFSETTYHDETTIFTGTAKEAIEKFPQNINVSIILSLAGMGTTKTSVTIIADPNVTRNSHTILAEGSFGKLSLTIENEPMPNNPKTSYLAALSAISTIQNKDSHIQLG